MAKRKFEMHEYRQIIVRLRLGESIRSIVQSTSGMPKKSAAVRTDRARTKMVRYKA